MYPITNEVMALFESEQRKVLRITGTDKNGATITITDNNVIEDSFQIDRYSCNGEKLEIGTAIAAQLTLKLENGNGQYDGIVFEGAELFVEVGIADWTQSSPTVTYIPCGYFTPDEQPRRLSTISITALDRMMRFDRIPTDWTPWTTSAGVMMTTQSGEPIYFLQSINFPCTVAEIVEQSAKVCRVPFTQDLSGLPNANISIAEFPTATTNITYRMLIQWCAGIMGTNAWIDWTGSLRFSWYNNATGYSSTIDNRYSSDMYEDDLTVTGVMYTTTGGVGIVEGTDRYAIDLTGNTLAESMISTILPVLNTALNGFTYRPFTAAVVNAPYLWPMDLVTFTDKNGNNHNSLLTNVCFGLNGTTALEARGMTYVVNRQKLPIGFTKQQAQLINEVGKAVDAAITEVDVEYAENQSTTTAPTSGWSSTAPAWREGYYIWQRTKTTTASETTYSQPTCISGRDGVDGQTGPQGPQGPQGQTGIGVSAVVEQYYLSTSSTEPTGGSWSTDQPQWVSGKYIWTRSQVTWTDNTTTDTAPVLAQAINGANSTANAASEAVTTLDNSLTQQNIFNRLTDNGAAQGIILYKGQLYINATYINAGLLSVGRIGFNDVEGHYQVPSENDPTSLLPGEAISDGWIIGTDSYQDITLLNCDFAVPLRGQTITLTFTYKTRVTNGISLYRAFESSDGAYVSYEDFWFPQTEPPYVPPNPYTYTYTVPNDAENLVFYVYGCDGVKNISVSVSGTPITPPTIKFDYAGLRIGNLLINRDGNVILDGYIYIDKPVYLSKVSLVEALSISNGGTGGSSPAAARENIGSGCASGSFETADGYTVTVEDGFITRIS